MRLTCAVFVLTAWCCAGPATVFAQDPTIASLNQQIEILQLKLQLAETSIDLLEKECAAVRKENADLKRGNEAPIADAEDQFKPGIVWMGTSVDDKKHKTRWALSISERDGRNFEGAIAAKGENGRKIEFSVMGKAPQQGDGLVIIESPVMGRAKMFMRGTLRNGRIALAFSGTTPLGHKFFGSADLAPQY